MCVLKAPFPWFGGKSRVAHLVWERFGDVPNYVEPFAGSLAVLLGRPSPGKIETVNDLDCFVANFWRALRNDPEAVAAEADWPVNEADLQARHGWLVTQEGFRSRMMSEPDYYDVKIAGWWVWGLSQWIGTGWCHDVRGQMPHLGSAGMGVHRKIPHLGDAGRGVHRKIPHLGDAGMGVHRQIPHLGDAAREDARKGNGLFGYMVALAERLRSVRVCCGDWTRVLGPTPTFHQGVTGVFLDPPYPDAGARGRVYRMDDFDLGRAVREWAVENGDNQQLRIALCGYQEAGVTMPENWTTVRWKARGGYGSQGEGRGRENARRETIWFSPHCLSCELFASC